MQTTGSVSFLSGPTPLHLKTIKRRFAALNGERVARVREVLTPEQRVFLDVLPLLLHINDSRLPGYVSKKTPAGVADFNPTKRAVEAAGKLARKFSYRRRAMRVYDIQALYIMGSVGTIAYTDKSDFDIWVCYNPRLSDNQVRLLREKCDHIRRWGESTGLDVKFFVLDPANLRRGETEELSEDSSGTAQQHLLLEEFYRTGLLLGGRYPAWWMVPPEAEHDYDAYLQTLISAGQLHEHEFVDFGGLTHVPASEFFGAALWQLHKAVDSPYKSVLKLLLMEAYSAEYPRADLLCTRFKQAVYGGETRIDNLDPYVLMVNKVQEYLERREEWDRLELARRCFYFKVNERLSERGPREPGPRRQLAAELARRWNWDHDQLLILDSRPTWKIHRVLEERHLLVEELTRSYRIVSDFARQHTRSSSINRTDLNLLGRRLYAAFERKAGKVEIINPGISTDLTEERLTFASPREHGAQGWLLQRGEPDIAAARQPTVLKRAQSLIELVAWCHFNRIIGARTLVTLHESDGLVSLRELLAVIDSFRRLFADGALPRINMDSLRGPANVVAGALFINLGIDPLLAHTRKGVHLTSNRSDALSYGGFWKNLAVSFDLLLVTSWREVLTFHYNGENALLNCLCDYLAWAPLSDRVAPAPLPVYSFSTPRAMAIAHRVEELFRDTIRAFYGSKNGHAMRYVLRIEHDCYLLAPENDVPRYQRVGSEAALIRYLGGAQETFSPVVFDRYAMTDSMLARLFEQNRPNVVQLFYLSDGAWADVYVLDERGSLFHQKAAYYSEPILLSHYQRFLQSAIGRCNASERSPEEEQISTAVELFKMRRDRAGQISITRSQPSQARAAGGDDYLSLQVIGESAVGGRTVFSLYCEGREFSSLEYGDGVFSEVAHYVLSHRTSDSRYPIYITDVDVDRTQLGAETAGTLQTVHFLNYKKFIEDRLNGALSAP